MVAQAKNHSAFNESTPHPIRTGGAAYARWREKKLADAPAVASDLLVELGDPAHPTAYEREQLLDHIRRHNMVLFRGNQPLDKVGLLSLTRRMGMTNPDNHLCSDRDQIASITVEVNPEKQPYIPYTNRAISWHSDGYYNDVSNASIGSFALYCVRPADKGGENFLIDHELAYIHLHDAQPELAYVLFHPRAMSIPPNETGGTLIRSTTTGPVFSWFSDGSLHMRYSARKRHIHWHDDPLIREAAIALEAVLNSHPIGCIEHRMQAGEGVLCNNVLHSRNGFSDGQQGNGRLLYRARFFDRIVTGGNDACS